MAIKAISPELVEDDLVRRFRAEAVTLAKVNHPNIATVYELFRDDECLLMVMELVRGETFEQLIERPGPMPVERPRSPARSWTRSATRIMPASCIAISSRPT